MTASPPPDDAAAADRTTGADDPAATSIQPAEQPDLRGTLFIMIIFLMMIFGFWLLMYFELLNR